MTYKVVRLGGAEKAWTELTPEERTDVQRAGAAPRIEKLLNDHQALGWRLRDVVPVYSHELGQSGALGPYDLGLGGVGAGLYFVFEADDRVAPPPPGSRPAQEFSRRFG